MQQKKLHITSSSFTFHRFFHQRRKVILIGLLLIAICEVFIFNLPFWETRSSQPEILTTQQIVTSGLTPTHDGFRVTDASHASIVVQAPHHKTIHYVQINVPTVSHHEKKTLISYTLNTYTGNTEKAYSGSSNSFYTGDKQSFIINAGATVSRIKIQFNEPVGSFIPFLSITLNQKIPFHISVMRVGIMLLIACLGCFFGAQSLLWRTELHTDLLSQKLMLAFNTILIMAFYVWMMRESNGESVYRGWYDIDSVHQWFAYGQYGNLANSLLHGHTWLDLPVSKGLRALPNPYSWPARIHLVQEGQKVFWDHAYYNGHYYCYFGVIPAIIFFMPYEILSGGQWLPSAYAILISVLLGAIFATLFVTRLAKTYFKDPSLGAVMFGIWMMGIGSGILYHVFTCSFYSVPEAASYMFTLAALWCWLSSIKHPNKVSIPWVFFGSLFMACNLGCRPQFMFAALLAIPIYWNAVFKDRSLFSRRGFWPTVMAILPFVLVFVPLMMYNVARFGSPLNFGNKYQLTVFDARVARFPLASLPEIVFYYLFQPAQINAVFPFVNNTLQPLSLYTPLEPSEGGFFTFVAPFALIIFLLPRLFSSHHNEECYAALNDASYDAKTMKHVLQSIVWVIVVSSAIVIGVDSLLGGFSQRYISDFGVLLIIASVIAVFLCLPTHVCEDYSRITYDIRSLLCVLLIGTFILEFFETFAVGRYGSVLGNAPWHYFPIQSWFLFL